MKFNFFVILSFIIVFFPKRLIAQDDFDIGTPNTSSFQIGNDISGVAQNSINQVSGKLAFSVPIGTVSSGPIGYNISLSYNGANAFKTAKELNKYNSTSTVGVGWSLATPKIVVDNKQTGTREDDVFYLVGDENNSRLVCYDKASRYWSFESENFSNWKITYDTWLDNWEIIKVDGVKYFYGHSVTVGKSKSLVSTWGNWIGSSNQNPTGSQAVAWNLDKIEDQWGNFVELRYDIVENRQNASQTLHKHTEASYIKEIISSKGAKVEFLYGNKESDEYYEPHREKSEPDAYQEQYEKKYLRDINIYNNDNTLVTSYDLTHVVNGGSGSGKKKRYLTKLTQISYKNQQSYLLPPQEFEYHLSGTYTGGLHTVTYPMGGSVKYNYENKYLFYNDAEIFNPPSSANGYNFYSAVVRDNYSLFVMRTANPVSNGKHRFKFFRFTWNGTSWDSNEFTFPHLMEDDYPNTGDRLKGFYSILEEDFYGFAFDKGSTADIYLFHKEKNGKDWDDHTHSNLNIDDGNPSFISGNNFVGLGSKEGGKLFTYKWNGSSWNFKQIDQGTGKYYYGATNNFILSLDVRIYNPFGNQYYTSNDMITGASYQDNYYIHYLDVEHKWQTKSWSSAADPSISGITDASKLFPSNSIAGFVADNNPELFLRWNNNYDLIAVDNVLGSYNDAYALQPVNNSMFTLTWYWANEATKSARFNGVNWSVSGFSSSTDHTQVNFGIDLMSYENESTKKIMYKEYSPNTHTWISNNLANTSWYTPFQVNGINSEFVVGNNQIFKRTYQGVPTIPYPLIGSLPYDNDFTYTDGLSHAFVKLDDITNNGSTASHVFQKGMYYYIDKETGLLSSIDLGKKWHLRGSQKLGGNTPFMSPKTLWVRQNDNLLDTNTSFDPYLYRIIDDKFNQPFFDIVIKSIELDDDNGNVRKVNYTYSSPDPTPDNNMVYYGNVTVENKGFGTNSIGKIKTIFNTGDIDARLAGLTLEKEVYDVNNILKKKQTNTWSVYNNNISNGSEWVDTSHQVRLMNTEEELYFNSQTITSQKTNSYNIYGQVSAEETTNSKGEVEKRQIKYAHEQYSFVIDKNMYQPTYETTTKLNNVIVDVNRDTWISSSGKIYLKENWSGPNANDLRLNNEISYVDTSGNALEANNGKGIYSCSLNAYNNNYEVASISNSNYQATISQLDVTYSQLQSLSTTNLKTELMKLYSRLPDAIISLTFYNENGRITNRVNERQEETYIYYDNYGRLDYITDGYGNVLEKTEHNFNN